MRGCVHLHLETLFIFMLIQLLTQINPRELAAACMVNMLTVTDVYKTIKTDSY